jgi:hypothetical protein
MAGRIAYYGNISPQGLVLNLDAAIVGSYPKTGSTWFDISNNGNNGTLTNGPTFTGSDYGAIRFDGTDDYVDTPYTTPIGTGGFAYNAWINFTSSQFGPILVKRIGGPTYQQFSLFIAGDNGGNTTGSKLVFNDVENTSILRLGITSGSYNDGRWHNVTVTRTATNTTMYVEGAPSVTIFSGNVNISSSSKLFIGRSGDNQTVIGVPFSGSIALAQVYNRSLSQFDVWQNFNAYKSRYGIPDIVTDGLVLNLDAGNPYSYLSGSSGTTWSNTVAVSSSISGTLTNGPVYSNGAITFDGSDDYVFISSSIPAGLRIGEGDFTIDFWIYTLGTGAYSVCGNLNDAEGDGSYWVLVNSTYTGLQTIQFGSKGNSEYKFGTTALTPNIWTNVTLSRIGTTMTAYINASTYATPITINNFTGNFNIDYLLGISKSGTNYNRYPLNGRLGVLKIYKGKGLTQTEITQNFNALRGRYGI